MKRKFPQKQKHRKRILITRKREKIYVVGRLRLHPKGFGFVECDDKVRYPQDIFIPRHCINHAVDGDRVEVLVRGEPVSEKGPEGRIATILERSRTHLAGTITEQTEENLYLAYAPLLGRERRVTVEGDREHPIRIGDRLVMKVLDWGTDDTETVCTPSHLLGNISDPSCDIAVAIEEYELRETFPHPAIAEAQAFGTRVGPSDFKDREDLRSLECFTIDPTTARDYDDAVSLSQDKLGNYHLAVHIADVSFYVKPNSSLDQEARKRCNSTYFPGKCVPMLPKELSNELCSLKPLVNRLAVTIFVDFDSSGEMTSYRIARTVIRSQKRFTYEEAKEVLDGSKKSPFVSTLLLMQELCHKLKKKRYERGGIEFALPELIVLCDDEGMPYGTEIIPYDITHQIVEEFMLKANEVVAEHLANEGKHLAYRIHDKPLEENLRSFAQLAHSFGFQLPDNPTVQDLQRLFDEAKEGPYAPHLATHYIRKMRLAIYSPDNIGHYGLNLSHYCHFTSPIRRYIDLVIHRILFGNEHEWEHLQEISSICSDQERVSAKAEGSVILRKKLRLLEEMKREDPHRSWPALITKVKKFGLFFEVVDLMLEGFVPISEIGDEYFVVDEVKMVMRGEKAVQHIVLATRLQ